MNKSLATLFNHMMTDAKKSISEGEYDNAFSLLEKAHVIGQLYVVPHTLTHYYMLKIGFLRKDIKEIIGQLIRIPLGIIGSFVGKVPTGNTGGSNISMFKKMEIPKELENHFIATDLQEKNR